MDYEETAEMYEFAGRMCNKYHALIVADYDADMNIFNIFVTLPGTGRYIKIPIPVMCSKEEELEKNIKNALEQLRIERRRDDMKDSSSDVLCVSREWFEEKQAEARQEGREEAWDLARRIVTTGDDCYTIDEVDKVFGNLNILRAPVEELLAKDKKYQEEKTLHVGDEVEFTATGSTKLKEVLKGYVIEFHEDWVRILTKDGLYRQAPVMRVKTGKHNQYIGKVMASFEEGEKDD